MRPLTSVTLGLSVYGIEDTGTILEGTGKDCLWCVGSTRRSLSHGILLCWFLVTALAGVPQALSFIGEDPQGCRAQRGIIPRSFQPA